MVSLMPVAKQQYFIPGTTIPLIGGKLYTYAAGTSTPKTTWQDAAGTTPNTNPITLDSTGSALIYWDGSYKIVLKDALGNTVYTVDNYNTDPYGFLQFFSYIGSSLIGFIQAGADAVASFIQDKLRESVSVLDFMTKAQRTDAVGRLGTVDVTTAIQNAINYVGSLPGGGRLYVPGGLYLVTATLNIPAKVYLYGDGQFASMFKVAHAGDFLKSSFPINASNSANINVKDLGAYAAVTSTGGGYVDVGGTYINVENCFFQGFKYNIILDQSELVVVDRCYFLNWVTAGVWLVNGPDHTAGANKGFTNRITITNNQFNCPTGYCVLDDGGGAHLIQGNNFNSSITQIRVSGCGGLSIINNEMELATAYPILFSETTLSGTYVGPCYGFGIRDNLLGGGAVSIFLGAAHGGEIAGNTFFQYTTCAIEADYGTNWRNTNINIGANFKALALGGGATVPPFFSTAAKKVQFARAGQVTQMGMTYCNQAPPGGSFVTTPVCMEDITEGCLMRVQNADGTNVETIQASNVTGTTFTATYATAKTPGFLIFVLPEQPSGTWTPTPSGSVTAGAWTTSALSGVWEREDNRATGNAQIVWSAMSASGQMQVLMPFKAKNNGLLLASPVVLTGPGAIAANVGQIAITMAAGSNIASMVYLNTSTGNFTALPCPASGSLYFSFTYEV